VLNRAEQIDQASSCAVNSPGRHDVELAAAGIAEHPVETRALVSVFCTRDAGITADFDHLASRPLGDLAQLQFLVLDRLPIGVNAHVERSPT
jgi:hypothetical protein